MVPAWRDGEVLNLKGIEMSLFARFVFALVAFVGCADSSDGGAIDVSWTIGGSTCNQSGVTRMVISLYVGGDVIQSAEAGCVGGTTRVEGVPAGTYAVEVAAYRADSADPAYVGRVTGVSVPKGGAVAAPLVELEEAPGAIDLSWRFDDGQLCRFLGIESVTVGVFDEFGRRAMDRDLACDPLPEAVAAEDGADSYLAGANGVLFEPLLPGKYKVTVLARRRDDDVRPAYFGSVEAIVKVYALAPAEVVLSPCPEGPDSPCL